MEANPVDPQSMPPAMTKTDAKTIAIISLSYTALNICISLLLFRDASPMSIYPAFVAFVTTFYLIKQRLPVKKEIAIFLCIYQVVIITGCIIMALQNGMQAMDFSKFLEPAFAVPVVAIFLLLPSAMNHQKVIPRLYLACGVVFVAIATFSIIPGNPVTKLMLNGGADYVLIDATITATLVVNMYLLFHVPFVMLFAGILAFIFGYLVLFTRKKIDNAFMLAMIIGVVFSLYAIGVAFTWMLLRRSRDAIIEHS
jgi:hypothetical protein